MMRPILLAIIAIQTVAIAYSDAQAAATLSRVEIQITDNYGHPLREARISINRAGISLQPSDRRKLELERGSYNIVVEVPGFDTFRKTVTIDQADQILSIAMRIGAYERAPVPCSIKGIIDPLQSGVRVRLMSIFGLEVRDAPVNEDGTFVFDTLECGAYMLLAISKGEAVGLAYPVATTQNAPVRLSIQAPKDSNVVPPKHDQ